MEKEIKEEMQVLVNNEGQYSLWPIWKEIPKGWKDTGFHGAREQCCDYVNSVWTDMRPLSLRRSSNPGNAV